jgi:hypothetical protein
VTPINPFRPNLENNDTIVRTFGGKVLGVYNEDLSAYRFEDCLIRRCLDEFDAWRFIIAIDRQRTGSVERLD